MSDTDNTPAPENKPGSEADAAKPEATTPTGTPATKPKFKVTRSPFAPKVDGAIPTPAVAKKQQPAEPKPETEAKAEAKPEAAPAAEAAKPAEATASTEAAKTEAAPAEAPAKPKPIMGKPTAAAPRSPIPSPLAGAKPTGAPKPAAAVPKPVAPISARKAAEIAEEEDDSTSPIALGVDLIAAGVAIAFAILIILQLTA